MSNFLRRIRIGNKKLLITIASVLILCGVGVGVWYWYTQMPKQETEVIDTSKENEPYVYPEASKEQADADKLRAEYENGDAEIADTQSNLKAAESAASSSAAKQEYALTRISLYMDANQIAQALAAAQEAENVYKSADTAAMLATVYNQRSDYANAAKFFQLAADRSDKPASPGERSPYNDFLIQKREAEAKL